MQYPVYDGLRQVAKPVASAFQMTNRLLKSRLNPLAGTRLRRAQSALLETSVRFLQDYPKQGWNYEDVLIGKRRYPVKESTLLRKPFCNLLRLRRARLPQSAPKVLFVAALSGHHATLSKATFAEWLPDHDVYVTDWLDARDVSLQHGGFGLEDYIAYLIEFLETLGEDTHVIALCQSGPAALTAAAVMSADQNPCRPASITLKASPMDMRVNPGMVSKASKYISTELWGLWGLHTVPPWYAGAGRKVYPGILQLSNFMSMNLLAHIKSHQRYAWDIYSGNRERAEKHREFYDEYYAILDMPAEFCLETLQRIFINNDLPRGRMRYQGELVDLGAITDISLLAVEGANDDMIRRGQCTAAVDMCSNLPAARKEKYVQAGVGHYGVFNSSIYRATVAPKLKRFLADSVN